MDSIFVKTKKYNIELLMIKYVDKINIQQIVYFFVDSSALNERKIINFHTRLRLIYPQKGAKSAKSNINKCEFNRL